MASACSKTRVCIKNLPPVTTEQDLKEFLLSESTTLEITDCRVLKNAKGKSRKVAFVGFRHEDQAQYVVNTFHRAFLRMSRLSVEPAMAKKVAGDDEKKPQTKKSSEEHTESSTKKDKSKAEEDTTFSRKKEEFLDLMMGGSKKSKFWANDEEGMDAAVVDPIPEDKGKVEESQNSSDSSSSSESSDDDKEDEMEESSKVEDPKEKPQTNVSDLDFLKSKQKSVDDLEEGGSSSSSSSKGKESVDATENKLVDAQDAEDDFKTDDSESSSDSDSDDEANEEMKDAPREDAAAANANMEVNEDDDAEEPREQASQARLFVRSLPFETTEEELEAYFSQYGKLIECHIPVDDQKRNKGFAFVTYISANDALEARTQLDKVDFQGRLLHILPARPPPSSNVTKDTLHLTWKQKQELARKEQETKSGKAAEGWSASFIRGDAVVDNLADRLGLRKGDILGVKDKLSSGDAAVRLALGETQIIEENREYFKKHGVDMDALVSASGDNTTANSNKRSKTAILVKNLPYDTTVEELAKVFHVGEDPVNILLPPSRTIAMVEYGHSTDAKRAFRKLAYRRFKHVPIYLEWAPLAAKSQTEPAERTTKFSSSGESKSVEEVHILPLEDPQEVDEEEDTGGVSSTIYVKNLNFETSEDRLLEVFEKHIGDVRSVKIPKKAAPVQSQDEEVQFLSMGYGFVELASHDLVKKAMKVLQGKLVEGHAWALTVSSKKGQSAPSSKTGGKNSTKLVVRNVPFQASRQELLKLFGSFGQLRKVRLPKKFDGTHRGFAFVEFLTSKEALAAMNALSRTHLYGRHLVLEWATDDDQNIDKLRQKATRDAGTSAQPKNKKIRFS